VRQFRDEVIGDARLILGDAREIVPTLGRFDALVTDPPYGVGLGTHGGAKDGRTDHVLVKRGYESYDDTEENLVDVVVPVVRDAAQLAQRGLVFCAGSNVWHFPRADLIGGVYLPAAQGRNKWGFTSFWPCLLYGRAPDLNLGSKATAYRSVEKSEHPCPKPVEWMEWAVDLASRPGETVLDPFAGSGTTGVACIKLGRKFVGIEIEPKYFDIACKRIEEASKQSDMFIERPAPPKQEVMSL
jgi:DNA modification methylase